VLILFPLPGWMSFKKKKMEEIRVLRLKLWQRKKVSFEEVDGFCKGKNSCGIYGKLFFKLYSFN